MSYGWLVINNGNKMLEEQATEEETIEGGLQECYNTGNDALVSIFGNYWRGQTFTPHFSHYINRLKLLLYKTGTPSNITISIKNTDEDGHPTGNDLCSYTFDGNTLTTSSSGEWKQIDFSETALLSAGTKYAIVAKSTDSNAVNNIRWLDDRTSPSYTRGNLESSSNGGSSWVSIDYDCLFEEWGVYDYIVEYPKLNINEEDKLQEEQDGKIEVRHDDKLVLNIRG